MASAAQLPACLSKLPSPQLEAVNEALLELLGCGLSEVTDVEELAKRVKAKLHAADSRRALPEDHPSEYASMCRWAWTPRRWHESRAAAGAPAGAPSADRGEARDLLPPILRRTQLAFDKLLGSCKQRVEALQQEPDKAAALQRAEAKIAGLSRWFPVMKAADDEIRALATAAAGVKTSSGDGLGVLFEQAPAVEVCSGNAAARLPKIPIGTGRKVEVPPAPSRSNPSPSLITLHLGKGGGETGAAAWETFMAEHRLDKEGRPLHGEVYGCSNFLFAEGCTGKYVPRTVFAGYEVSSAAEAASFAPTSIFRGVDPQPGDWYHGNGDSKLADQVLEGVRRQLELCDFCDGMLVTHDAGENICENGFAARVLQTLALNDLKKKVKMAFTCVPDPTGFDDAACDYESYATASLLGLTLVDSLDLVVFYDANGLRQRARAKWNGLGLQNPDGTACRGLVSRLLSNVTGPQRFGGLVPSAQGSRLAGISSVATNLAPFPVIKFLLPALGGLSPGEDLLPATGQPRSYAAASCALRSGALCTAQRRPSQSTVLTRGLFCRGMGSPLTATSAIKEFLVEPDVRTTSWCAAGFLVSNFQDPASASNPEVALLQNTSDSANVFESFYAGLSRVPETFAGFLRGDGDVNEAMNLLREVEGEYKQILTPVCEDGGNEGEDEEEGEEEEEEED